MGRVTLQVETIPFTGQAMNGLIAKIDQNEDLSKTVANNSINIQIISPGDSRTPLIKRVFPKISVPDGAFVLVTMAERRSEEMSNDAFGHVVEALKTFILTKSFPEPITP